MPSKIQTVIHDWSLKRHEAGVPTQFVRAPADSENLANMRANSATTGFARVRATDIQKKKTPSRSGPDTPVRHCQRSDTGIHECWSVFWN